ncbi:hypothetical protein GUJ93_ZPchr0006g41497 [Zizania palustris]|uniref:Uncharacterized protein n=1 Tax=Zizania palustris TaxID=103762 RepID=A0A8J5SIG1_ZIZPA|nr:hypothetical protein GUJ93_ZPchr0006g41497 [Zizania palustris]
MKLGTDAASEERRDHHIRGGGGQRKAEPIGKPLGWEDESKEGVTIRGGNGGEEWPRRGEQRREELGERRVPGGQIDEGRRRGGGDEHTEEERGQHVGEEGARVVADVAAEEVARSLARSAAHCRSSLNRAPPPRSKPRARKNSTPLTLGLKS